MSNRDEIGQLIETLRARIADTRHPDRSDFSTAVAGGRLADTAERLLEAIQLRAYPTGEHPDERAEHVVITVHGVDLSIRGREHDLFVHIDTTDRDTEDAERYPLALEVNDGGESEYS